MARRASATDMSAYGGGADGAVLHGGDLGAARRLFPSAPEPFIDLSTGINPHPYPLPRFSAALFARLPEPDALAALVAIAARAYGAPDPACVVAAPGTQILLPLAAALVSPGRAAILTPTYGEFARVAALAGHVVHQARQAAECSDAELVIVANPNNPDGRLLARETLLTMADTLRRRGGILIVDEAYMDAGPDGASLAAEVMRGGVVVLRSFGKFFGLAGVRLGFGLAAPPLAARLSAALGPWAVSAPAIAVATRALADRAWIGKTRLRLTRSAARLDTIANAAGVDVFGGTTLFRLVRTAQAAALSRHLGRAGLLVRAFPDQPDWLRFGLPGNERAWRRLETAMSAFR